MNKRQIIEKVFADWQQLCKDNDTKAYSKMAGIASWEYQLLREHTSISLIQLGGQDKGRETYEFLIKSNTGIVHNYFYKISNLTGLKFLVLFEIKWRDDLNRQKELTDFSDIDI